MANNPAALARSAEPARSTSARRFFPRQVGRQVLRVLVLSALAALPLRAANIGVWLTTPDKQQLLAHQPAGARFEPSASADDPQIEIDPSKQFQTIDGFGYTLTGGSALHMMGMSAEARHALVQELFGREEKGIGVSCLRLSIGASDLDARLFSYDDIAAGETDFNLAKFTLDPDRAALLPVLKEILKVAPDLVIIGSPWSPPAWMKTNNDTRGGRLKPECFSVYAKYLVKYVEGMKAEGVPIEGITVQNEPLHPGNNPSLLMPAAEQAGFVAEHLGPAFKTAGLRTRLIIYDHNADRPDYPISILDNPVAKQFVDGSAFHLYGGKIEALSTVHEAHPDKHIYFTEQWIGAPGKFPSDLSWHVKHLIIGATRNWARTVLEWNLSSNPQLTPHTDRGGCDRCLGAVTIDGDKVTRNPAYYIIAHASRFVRRGSVRIASTLLDQLPNVAFKTPEGRTVLIVLNEAASKQSFAISTAAGKAMAELPSGAVGTFVW